MINKYAKYFTGFMTFSGSLIGGHYGLEYGYILTMNETKLFDYVPFNTMTTVYGMAVGGICGTLWCISLPILIHKKYYHKK